MSSTVARPSDASAPEGTPPGAVDMSGPRFSFVVPTYGDHYLLDEFCVEFERRMSEYTKRDLPGDVELLIVDDGSPAFDRDFFRSLVTRHPFVRVVRLSRNFGQHIALSCGYREARGEYVGMLNADMEDPPRELPKLLDRIRGEDLGIVYGLRSRRYGPLGPRLTSRAFNAVLNKLTGQRIPHNVATMRIMSRPFVDAYNRLSESSRFIPGLENWLGFERDYVRIDHQPRQQGRSSYNFGKRLRMATESIISFSDLPLKMVAIGGLIVAAVGFALAVALIVARLVYSDFEAGYASTISIIIFLGGIQILVVGVASVYIGRVLREVQGRPLYLVRETLAPGDSRRAATPASHAQEPST
jgi:glycosyltransferase involved in cell wall biosynthesis